ncbi:hypothetical protein K0U07_02210 [bacterium]|nr:hypothetical protein [bacterium]
MNKSKIITLLLFLPAILSADDPLPKKAVAGNVKAAHREREFGKVSREKGHLVPPSAGVAASKRSFSLTAAYTLWQGYFNGINVASSRGSANQIGTPLTPTIPIRNGLKVSASKNLFYDNWQASLTYTWYYNPSPLGYANYNPALTYTSPWVSGEYSNLSNIKSSFYNQFNRIHVKMFRVLRHSKYLLMTPWIGLQGVWETEDLHMDTEVIARTNYLFSMKNTQFWWCIGPFAGTKLILPILPYISLYANAGAGLHLTKRDLYQYKNGNPQNPEELLPTSTTENHQWFTEAMMEGSLGLSMSHDFAEITCFTNIAWQVQTWFSHCGYVTNYLPRSSYGNYSLQGLTIKIGATF